MDIHRAKSYLYIILISGGFSADCTCCLTEQYFNESILAYYTNILDAQEIESQPLLFSYALNITCANGPTHIQYEYSISAPEIGITTFETYYEGVVILDLAAPPQHITNLQFTSGIGPNMLTNTKTQLLATYISQKGTLPNGIYNFTITLKNNANVLYVVQKTLQVQAPQLLELFSPGGVLTDISNSFTFSSLPLFSWYSDFCPQCEFAIRVCEYDQNQHGSLEDALAGESLVPFDQRNKFHELGWNSMSFQYPPAGHYNLEVGKFYVWQIRKSLNSTVGVHRNFSPVYVFEVRAPDKLQMDYSDPYLTVIESLIGEEQFNLWFNTGGELERFTTEGNSFWINNDEMHIDGLYSLLSDLNREKIKITDVKIK